jgi:phosphate transport system permease protein
MATADAETAFGRVSRTKGFLFRWLTLAASLFGIVALAVLLVFVIVDAFGLKQADPLWIVAAVATGLGPVLGLWLYAADDRDLTIHAAITLVGGAVAAYLLELGLGVFGAGIPLLNWSLFWLFAVVIPTTSYVLYVGIQSPIGGTGAGLLGRLVAGTALGFFLYALFVVFEPTQWVLIYTMAIVPWALLTAISKRRESSVLDLAPVPVGVLGFLLAVWLSDILVFYVLTWVLHLWAIALPAAAIVGLAYWRRRGRRSGAVMGLLAFLLPTAGSLVAGVLSIPPRHALLVLVPLVILPGTYLRRVLERKRGRLGLIAPVVVAGAIALAWFVPGALGLNGPHVWLDGQFLTNAHSNTPADAGLYPAIIGSVAIVTLVAIVSFVFGVGAAVFLEDYTSDEGLTGAIVRLIQVNIANLAAVPSVVYGLLGLALFGNLTYTLPLLGFTYTGTGVGTVLTAGLTLSLLILPVTIIAAQEAVRAVPDSLRRGSYAMGATRWQTTKEVVLPEAMPGILTGTILALGRAIGETAPLIMIGLATTSFSPPNGFASKTTAMPMQVFAWHSFPGPAFRHGVLAAGVVTMLAVLLLMNGAAIVLRNKYESGDV